MAPSDESSASHSSEATQWKKFRKTELGKKVAKILHEIRQTNKTQDVEKALSSMTQLTDLAYVPSQETYASILNLACSQGPERWSDVQTVLDSMARHNVSIGEAGLSALIRLHMASGDTDAALTLLHEMEQDSDQPLKRRAVLPVLEGVCDAGDGSTAMHVLDIFRRNNIAFQEEELLSLVTLCGHKGQEHRMGMVLSEMSPLLYRLGPRLSTRLAAWFESQRWNVQAARVCPSGVCSCCGGQLQSVHAAAASVRRIKMIMEQLIVDDLDGKSRSHELLHNTNIFRGGTPQGLRGANLLNKFKSWLQANGPYEVFVDGANLGFHKGLTSHRAHLQAAGKPHSNKLRLDYQMMDDVMEQLARLRPSAKLLMVLHAQHVLPNRLKPSERAIVDRWKAQQRLYATPGGMNDDWFWLYAALDSSETRRSTMLVSNDQMRDHQWALNLRITLDDHNNAPNLNPNLAWRVQEHKDFLRWKERHWVTYFVHRAGKAAPQDQAAQGDGNRPSRWRAQFHLPLKYSVCMQALPLESAVEATGGAAGASQGLARQKGGGDADECGGLVLGGWQHAKWHLPLERAAHGGPESDRSMAGISLT
jgi:proteinaceous RNase P